MKKQLFQSLAFCWIFLGLISVAHAANEVFLSNDTAESEVTYVIQFDTGVRGRIDKIRVALPPDTNAANAVLGRLIIRDKLFDGDEERNNDVKLSVDPLDPNALIVDLRDAREAKAGTRIRIELFNLNNPPAGTHEISIATIGRHGTILETIPSIFYSTFAGSGSGDITAVIAETGLTGGGTTGNVNLSITPSYQLPQSCTNGQVAKSNGLGSWACQNDSDTTYTAGAGLSLTGTAFSLNQSFNVTGTIGAGSFTGDGSSLTNLNASNLASGIVPNARLSGTYSINISGSASTATSLALNPVDCAAGAFAQAIDASGNLTCSTNGSSLTSLSPANLSAGTAGINISGNAATATSATSFSGALSGDVTGTQGATTVARIRGTNVSTTAPTTGQVLKYDGANWAPSADAGGGGVTAVTASSPLSSSGGTTPNITLPNVKIESTNTAIGTSAFQSNTTGINNTATGRGALQNNTEGTANTASGVNALVSNTIGASNTAIGTFANVSVGDLTNATAIGASPTSTVGGD